MIFGRNNFKTKESGWHFTPPTVLFVPIFKKKEVKNYEIQNNYIN